MNDWKQYKRKGITVARPYIPGEDLSGVAIHDVLRAAGHPKEGDVVARDPNNHADQWLLSEQYVKDNLEPA